MRTQKSLLRNKFIFIWSATRRQAKTNKMNQTSTTPEENLSARQNYFLNVIKGLAIFGLLLTTIWVFGGFANNERTYYKTGTHGGNYYLLSVNIQ